MITFWLAALLLAYSTVSILAAILRVEVVIRGSKIRRYARNREMIDHEGFDVHVVPHVDTAIHRCDKDCWCFPVYSEEEEAWLHQTEMQRAAPKVPDTTEDLT